MAKPTPTELARIRRELRQLVDQSLAVYRRKCLNSESLAMTPFVCECITGASAAAALTLRRDFDAATDRIAAALSPSTSHL